MKECRIYGKSFQYLTILFKQCVNFLDLEMSLALKDIDLDYRERKILALEAELKAQNQANDLLKSLNQKYQLHLEILKREPTAKQLLMLYRQAHPWTNRTDKELRKWSKFDSISEEDVATNKKMKYDHI
jgi:hypothetical protein